MRLTNKNLGELGANEYIDIYKIIDGKVSIDNTKPIFENEICFMFKSMEGYHIRTNSNKYTPNDDNSMRLIEAIYKYNHKISKDFKAKIENTTTSIHVYENDKYISTHNI